MEQCTTVHYVYHHPSHTLHYITLHYNHTISHNRHNDCQVSSDSKYYHNGWMGFPDENIQITSDLWITYEEEYIIVIQPEVDREGSLTTSNLPSSACGERDISLLFTVAGLHKGVLDCFMLQTCCCFCTSLWILNIDNTEPGVSELEAFALAPGLLEVILDYVTVLGLLLVRFLCKRFWFILRQKATGCVQYLL